MLSTIRYSIDEDGNHLIITLKAGSQPHTTTLFFLNLDPHLYLCITYILASHHICIRQVEKLMCVYTKVD